MEVVADVPAANIRQDIIETHFGGDYRIAEAYLGALNKANEIRRKKGRQEQRKRQAQIFFEAQSIGADYYEASKKIPDVNVMQALHHNGYGPNPADYLGEIFYDLEDFQSHVVQTAQDRAEERKAKPLTRGPYQDWVRYKREVLAASIMHADPEYYYDINKRSIVVLGKLALSEFDDENDQNQLRRLSENSRLVIGVDAEKYSQRIASDDTSIRLLGEILVDKTTDLKRVEPREDFTGWTPDDFLSYGKWLFKVLKPVDKSVTYDLLRKAYRMGLGPNVKTIEKYGGFEGTKEYIKLLGRINKAGSFDDWTYDDFVEHLRRVISETDGPVTKSVLLQRVRSGLDEPTAPVIALQTGKPFSVVLEDAGQQYRNKRISREEIIDQIVEFERQNDRRPISSDFANSPLLCSEARMFREFGSIGNMNAAVDEWFIQTRTIDRAA